MVEVHKVKAHASLRDVASELTTWTVRAGNNAADEAAKSGAHRSSCLKRGRHAFRTHGGHCGHDGRNVGGLPRGGGRTCATRRIEARDTQAAPPPLRQRLGRQSPPDPRQVAQVVT